MSDESDGKDESDEKKVGYKKPPQHSRWKKGQCGNPRGRTKGALNLKNEVKLMLEAPVTVNDRGKPKRMTTLKAALWRIREKALKGHDRSIELLLNLVARYVGLAPDSTSDISDRDKAIFDHFCEKIRAKAVKDQSSKPDEDIK
jgi:hypothetical protein